MGPIGRKIAETQRRLNSPRGRAQPSFIATIRASNRATVHTSLRDCTPCSMGVDAAEAASPQTVHSGGKLGDKREALSRAFVDKAVVAPIHCIYISSCPKGQVRTARTEPGSDPRSGIGSQVRWSQGQRARFTGGTRRLRTCSEPKGGRLAGFLPVPSGIFVCPAQRPRRVHPGSTPHPGRGRLAR